MAISIGTAGWSLPRAIADRFPDEGSALERYASAFPIAEINSSFHRPHRTTTWERWRDSVPDDFRFAAKVPKEITHVLKLVACDDPLERFLGEVSGLGHKLAMLLVQLPPKLEFDPAVAASFFEQMQRRTDAAIACEPRHLSWFTEEADDLLTKLEVTRVAADPSICEAAARPGGSAGISYWRLHGSPVTYRSSYQDRLEDYARKLREEHARGADVWCIFDNTASSAAAADALALLELLGGSVP